MQLLLERSSVARLGNSRCNGFVPIILGAFLMLNACGDEAGDARSACDSVAEAWARAWDRCDRDSYDRALDLFTTQLGCGEVDELKGNPDRCVNALDDLNCAQVDSGSNPGSCQELLGGG